MEHSPIISILICTLENRKDSFNFIYNKLKNQSIEFENKVEIIFKSDNGEMTIGTKRNSLLFDAKGEYICFVDDDDDVSDDYIKSIINALKDKPDCVGIEGIIKINNKDIIFRHSIQFQAWYTGIDGYYRTPNHLNPVKREISLKVCFPFNISFGEDQIYSDGIKHYIKNEKYINYPIYFYKKEFNQ
jgi:cellulose synthase/poly-beta-1,6-N-acetylglucosamine synthase-like glycosyltransferase